MNHYVYKLVYGNQFYIGVRSCKCLPADDTKYRGSGVHPNRPGWWNATKEILSTHPSREDAEREESRLLALHSKNPWSRNRKRSCCYKYAHV